MALAIRSAASVPSRSEPPLGNCERLPARSWRTGSHRARNPRGRAESAGFIGASQEPCSPVARAVYHPGAMHLLASRGLALGLTGLLLATPAGVAAQSPPAATAAEPASDVPPAGSPVATTPVQAAPGPTSVEDAPASPEPEGVAPPPQVEGGIETLPEPQVDPDLDRNAVDPDAVVAFGRERAEHEQMTTLKRRLRDLELEQAETSTVLPWSTLIVGIAAMVLGVAIGVESAVSCDSSCTSEFWPGWVVTGGATVSTVGLLWLKLTEEELAELRSRHYHLQNQVEYIELNGALERGSSAGLRGPSLQLRATF